MSELAKPIELQNHASALLAQAHDLSIVDRASAERATDCVKLIKTLIKKADEERKTWVEPLNNQVSRINAEFKAITEPLKKAEDAVKAKLIRFQQEEEAKARAEAQRKMEEEAAALAAAENARADGDDDIAEAIVEQVASQPDPSIVKPVAPVRSDYGSVASIRKGWSFSIVSYGEVPRQYLMLDENHVRAAIREGARAIPGLLIFETQTAVIR